MFSDVSFDNAGPDINFVDINVVNTEEIGISGGLPRPVWLDFELPPLPENDTGFRLLFGASNAGDKLASKNSFHFPEGRSPPEFKATGFGSTESLPATGSSQRNAAAA